MKRSLILTICTIFSFSLFGQGIEFVHLKWQEAVEMAKAENKLLFVDSYAEWCGPCKRMAKNEFTKTDVGQVYNDNFINLKLDMESKNGRTFDSKYPVSAYPTMFFLDGEGVVVKKVRGGQKGDQLIAMAKAVIKSYDTSGKFKEKYDAGDRSYDVVYSYVEALNKASKPSLRISNSYIKSKPDITNEQLLKFYHVATVDADSKIFETMVKKKSEIVALIGAEGFDNKVKSACDNTIKKAIEYETESLLDEAVMKAKSSLSKGGDIYGYEATMKYAIEMKDVSKYKASLKPISKIYLESDPEKMKPILLTLMDKFGDKEDVMDMAEKIGKKYFKKAKTVDSALTFCKVLMMKGDYDGATKTIEKSLKYAEKSGEKTKPLTMMLKLIEKRRA